MRYQLFLPSIKREQPQELIRLGLDDHIAGANWTPEATGPDGHGGVLVSWPTKESHEFGFRPKEQTWLPAARRGEEPKGRYWVGLWTASLPTPAELKKPSLLSPSLALHDGYLLTLGDRQEWQIPAAVMLPRDLTVDPDTGAVVEVIQRAYQDFWQASQEWYQRFMTADPDAGELHVPANWWDYLCMALRLNYRIVPEVVSHLRLFNTENAARVALATVQGQAISEVEKDLKKTAE